jgi:hypothetical protein
VRERNLFIAFSSVSSSTVHRNANNLGTLTTCICVLFNQGKHLLKSKRARSENSCWRAAHANLWKDFCCWRTRTTGSWYVGWRAVAVNIYWYLEPRNELVTFSWLIDWLFGYCSNWLIACFLFIIIYWYIYSYYINYSQIDYLFCLSWITLLFIL